MLSSGGMHLDCFHMSLLLVVRSPCCCPISPREGGGKQSQSELDGGSQGAARGLHHQLHHLFGERRWTAEGLYDKQMSFSLSLCVSQSCVLPL